MDKYRTKGLQLIAVPMNEFDNTAPQSSRCERSKLYEALTGRPDGGGFPVLDKVVGAGARAPPFLRWLLEQTPRNGGATGALETSYEKFLVDSKGALVKRYRAFDHEWVPDVSNEIEKLLSP